jgi:hypothetical protein
VLEDNAGKAKRVTEDGKVKTYHVREEAELRLILCSWLDATLG